MLRLLLLAELKFRIVALRAKQAGSLEAEQNYETNPFLPATGRAMNQLSLLVSTSAGCANMRIVIYRTLYFNWFCIIHVYQIRFHQQGTKLFQGMIYSELSSYN